ncbi:hypothetical protein OH76DRAFT_811383 [Lentinus brumalis]|uniref:Secreted protein n=1 Tax=Lentinus brumalis TaxID=2498619 RepID=A0A371D347_9APHY|nr:hypothetical protein OH76DRAFT_811383 [Polyporus brumalis]
MGSTGSYVCPLVCVLAASGAPAWATSVPEHSRCSVPFNSLPAGAQSGHRYPKTRAYTRAVCGRAALEGLVSPTSDVWAAPCWGQFLAAVSRSPAAQCLDVASREIVPAGNPSRNFDRMSSSHRGQYTPNEYVVLSSGHGGEHAAIEEATIQTLKHLTPCLSVYSRRDLQ